MAKHRIKWKRKKENSKRSQPPASAAPNISNWALALTAVVCIGIAGLFLLTSLSEPEEELLENKTPSGSMAEPNHSVLTKEEEIAALKAEEMQMTRQLLKDFPRNDVTLAFVGSVYRQRGNSTKAVKLLNKALELNPNRPDVYNALGGIAFSQGLYEQAITCLNKALKIDAKQPGFRSSIAFSLMALGRYAEAIEQLNENVQIFPESVYSHFLLGQAYLQQGDYDKARKHYLTAIKIDQSYVNAYYGLFTACSRLKQQDEAREYMAAFKKLKAEEMKASKTRDRLYNDLVSTRQMVAENQIFAARIYQAGSRSDKAEELLQKAVKLDPNNTECLTELAGLYSTTNRPAEALKMYKRISEIQPRNPVCFFNIGVISAMLNRFDEAEEALREVIELAPEESGGYRELARLYLSTKKSYGQTRKLAEKAVKLSKTAANYHVLSCACELDGDKTNALKAIEKAMQLDPDNVEYRQTYQRIRNRK